MDKVKDKYLYELDEELCKLFDKIRTKSNLEYSINIDRTVITFVLHKHLKLTVVYANQYDEAVIYLDGRFTQYTHWHLDNYEAIKFVDDMVDEKEIFIESKFFRSIGSQFAYKVLNLDKYNLVKNHFIGKRTKNIFTASQIIQGNLKKLFR